MNKEDIDKDYYSEIIKQQARNESDKVRKLKRKIEDNAAIRKELTGEEHDLLIDSLENEAENLEQIASMSEKILEEKLDETD